MEPLRGGKHSRTDVALSSEISEALLELIPNVTSMSVPFAPGVTVVPCLLKANRGFTCLEISSWELPDEMLVKLIRMCVGSLERLLDGFWRLGPEACSTICSCSKLRCLDICGATSFNDSHMEELVLNAPDLISLKLSGCFCLDDAGVAHIHGYRGLQELSLSNALPVTSSAKCSLDRIPSLRELHFDERFLDRDLLQSMMSVTVNLPIKAPLR